MMTTSSMSEVHASRESAETGSAVGVIAEQAGFEPRHQPDAFRQRCQYREQLCLHLLLSIPAGRDHVEYPVPHLVAAVQPEPPSFFEHLSVH